MVAGDGTKKKREENLALFVPRVGLEPTRPNGHMALNHACLPISAPGRCVFTVTWLGLEPRTLSLKVRCSNQLSYQVIYPIWGGKDSQNRYSAKNF